MKKNRYQGSYDQIGQESDDHEAAVESYERMKEDLDAYSAQGIVLKLSGRKASSARIANVCCIRESGSYMSDYVLDQEDKLIEICFNRIRRR